MISAGCMPISLGRVWIGVTCPSSDLLAAALRANGPMSSLCDPEDDFPTRHDTLMSSTNPDDRDTNPASAEPPSEGATRTENERPALAPPKMPTDLESSALASKEPPLWFKESFIGQALTDFANDARDIREGRNRQHAEQMEKLGELAADQSLLRGELKAFRKSTDARLAEGDERFTVIEQSLDALKRQRAEDQTRITELERLLGELKANGPARQAPAAPTG